MPIPPSPMDACEPSRMPDARLAARLTRLERDIESLRADMLSFESARASALESVAPERLESARNLLHYIALRRHDVRGLQRGLASVGLSSLGRSESHVLGAVNAVREVLCRLRGGSSGDAVAEEFDAVDAGRARLDDSSAALLGPRPTSRRVRIMVTMPSEAADDPGLIRGLLEDGMDCMRINCAHDDEPRWERMIRHLRAAEAATGRACKVLIDLGGPKIRTGPLPRAPGVVSWRPARDEIGRVVAPARIRLCPAGEPLTQAEGLTLPVETSGWLRSLEAGASIEFRDARGKERSLLVVEARGDSAIVESSQTAYMLAGTMLRDVRSGAEGWVAPLFPRERPLTLHPRDRLIVRFDSAPGAPARRDAAGAVESPAEIGCTLPEFLRGAAVNDRIWFDDGKIGGVVRAVLAHGLEVEIVRARAAGGGPAKLRSDKGINLPDSATRVSALTRRDLDALPFVAAHADMVGLSFVQSAADVRDLRSHLVAMSDDPPAIVLKIETARAFRYLPELLLEALSARAAGVMIARGDLAVEIGYERLAEVQEEILWMCEAAHVPVIWATQVLETLAKSGMPSRAEITDAAMGERAECVMLNKGPYISEAVRVLDGILRRMEAHQFKKSAMLRPLKVASRFAEGRAAPTAMGTAEPPVQ